jgi:hypothetical protein
MKLGDIIHLALQIEAEERALMNITVGNPVTLPPIKQQIAHKKLVFKIVVEEEA